MSENRVTKPITGDLPSTSSRPREFPRWLAKIRAGLGGYFWLPCRVCGRMYGGFECSEVMVADKQTGELLGPNRPPGMYQTVCRRHDPPRRYRGESDDAAR